MLGLAFSVEFLNKVILNIIGICLFLRLNSGYVVTVGQFPCSSC